MERAGRRCFEPGRSAALNVAIRRGDEGDLPFILDLGKRIALTSVSPLRAAMKPLVDLSFEKLVDFIVAQSHVILIAQDDAAKPAGFLLLLDTLPDEVTLSPQAFVAYMAVEPAVHRRGIGRSLLNAAEAIARERGLPAIAMMVTEANDPALELYASSGYRTERRLLCKPLT